jgi:hypothetical protein
MLAADAAGPLAGVAPKEDEAGAAAQTRIPVRKSRREKCGWCGARLLSNPKRSVVGARENIFIFIVSFYPSQK